MYAKARTYTHDRTGENKPKAKKLPMHKCMARHWPRLLKLLWNGVIPDGTKLTLCAYKDELSKIVSSSG